MNNKLIIASAAVFSVAAISIYLMACSKQRLVTVDTTALISKQAQDLATRYPGGKVSSEQLQHTAEQIKEKVALFAKDHGFIILAKGAVWGGNLPDYTEQALDYISIKADKDS